MNQRIRRKDLKRNDLVESMGRTVDYVSHHRKGVAEGIIIAACVAAAVAGVLVYRVYRESAAGSELSRALEILDTPIAGQAGAAPAPRTFATAQLRDKEADRYLRAAASFGAHRGGPRGRRDSGRPQPQAGDGVRDVCQGGPRRQHRSGRRRGDWRRPASHLFRQERGGDRAAAARDRVAPVARAQGRASLCPCPGLRESRVPERRARHLPAADQRLSEFGVPFRRARRAPGFPGSGRRLAGRTGRGSPRGGALSAA